MTASRMLLGLGSLILAVACSTVQAEEKIKVLIVDGQNNHDWKATTPVLKQVLEACGRFTVDVSTTPPSAPQPPRLAKDANAQQKAAHAKAMEHWKADKTAAEKASAGAWDAWRPKFDQYQVVVSNYNGAPWPEPVRADFVKFIANGGGLVSFHAADNAFSDWPEYNLMIGVGGWGGRNEKSGPMLRLRDGKFIRDETPGAGGTHGPAREYVVEIRNSEHPITHGLPVRWLHAKDELYSKLRGPAQNLTVLATAFADPAFKGCGEHEPLLMAITYGKGRIFHDALGHNAGSMVDVGFIVTLQRGTEWAATGAVTIPPPKPEEMSTEKVITRP